MGLKDDVTGKAKEAEGKLTDDKSREAEGELDQAEGKAKGAIDDVEDAAGKPGCPSEAGDRRAPNTDRCA